MFLELIYCLIPIVDFNLYIYIICNIQTLNNIFAITILEQNFHSFYLKTAKIFPKNCWMVLKAKY